MAAAPNDRLADGPPHREILALAIMLAGLFIVNLATSDRFPVFWQDEAAFADLAIGYASGHGFTSTVWTCGKHSIDDFFACSAPGYSFLLGNWIKLFGIGIASVRSLNYVIISGVLATIWLFLRRSALLKTPSARLIAIAAILCGYGVSLDYRSARYDCLGMLIFWGALLASTIRASAIRYTVLVLLGALLPLAGIQLIPYAAITGFLLLLLFRLCYWREMLAVSVGIAAGGTALLCLFAAHGVLANFFAALATETPPSFAAKFTAYNALPRSPKDPSLLVALALGLGLILYQLRRGTFALRSAFTIGVLAGLAIPAGMFLAGKFPTYYSWMAYVPVCIGLSSILDRPAARPPRLLEKRWAVGALIAASSLGLPLELASAAYYWSDRDSRLAETLVARHVSSSDWAYVEYGAFLPTKQRTHFVFMPYGIPPDHKQQLTVLIVEPREFEDYVHPIVGGNWVDTGDALVAHRVDLFRIGNFAPLLQRRLEFRVYRRR